MIRSALCGGSGEAREKICAALDGLSLKFTEYESAQALLWEMESGKLRYELYILDLPGDGGEELKRLRALDDEGVFILLTDSAALYEKAFEQYALGCLRKPVGKEKLRAVAGRAVRELGRGDRRVLAVTWRGSTSLLRHKDIEYISSANHALRFHLRGGEERVCYARLDKVAAQLPEDRFVRCHQSHIINLSYVTGYTSRAVHMSGVVLPISRSCAAQAKKALERYFFLP